MFDTGDKCDFITSACNENPTTWIASRPGNNMVESTQVIAGKLFDKVKTSLLLLFAFCLLLIKSFELKL